jgi:Ca-activated chloride channel family protein|tara:strand:- start:1150 stop:2508 length:1359 start_codon:yes stop_codon:yes gene_type:complete
MKNFLTGLIFTLITSFSLAQTEQSTTRILFIFDASQSMFGHFGGAPKIDIAQKMLSAAVDSLKSVPNLELALRVYGNRSQIKPGFQDCEDTHLEVPFGPGNIPEIKNVLKSTYPKGTTPIAKSLEETINDFTPCSNCRNIVILITDGLEACDGDPCAISRALMKNGIYLKPFVIGLGVLEEFKRNFYCIGNFYDAKDKGTFKTVLSLVLNEAINSTSVQVNLLDVNGEPIETNVNMTFYDQGTGKMKYNFVHTMNFQDLPDTLSIDPSVHYKIVVHTIPSVKLTDVVLKPGQHNIIPIETPQGSISLKVNGGRGNNLKFIVKEEEECTILNVQKAGKKVKYLVGTYDIEVLTIPRIKTTIEVAQSKDTNIEIPAPGIVAVKVKTKGYGSLYVVEGDDQFLVYSIDPKMPTESIQLQPGNYKYVFRGERANRAFYTVEKDFIIKSGKSVVITL